MNWKEKIARMQNDSETQDLREFEQSLKQLEFSSSKKEKNRQADAQRNPSQTQRMGTRNKWVDSEAEPHEMKNVQPSHTTYRESKRLEETVRERQRKEEQEYMEV